MAPKRVAMSPGPSTPKGKKAKLSMGQKTLHSFFRSPSLKSPEDQGSTAEMQDRELVELLARKDGIDVEITKHLEASWQNTRASSSGRNANDAIEVDLDQVSSGNTDGTTSVSTIIPGMSQTHPRDHVVSGSKLPEQTFLSTVSPLIDVTPQSSASLKSLDLCVDPATFAVNSNPPWSPLTQTPYSCLVQALSTLSQMRSRILILNTLTNYLRLISLYHPPSLLPSLYLLSNTLAPPYLSVELGLGVIIISRSIQQVSGLTSAALSKLYRSLGDPGDVAFAAKSSVRTLIPHSALTVLGVYGTMLKISRAQGQGAAKIKQSLVEKLLLSAKGEESRYLVRTLCQNLRVGAVRKTIISALARAMVFPPLDPSALLSCLKMFNP
ncbi:ATP-dependent DNA ligase [Gautieria morchelliformis]|nr:ATP-dependent DNA ligase [Gautieria morchelliformis]